MEFKCACQHTHARTHTQQFRASPPTPTACFLVSLSPRLRAPFPLPSHTHPQPQFLLVLNSQTTRLLLREAFPDAPAALSAALCARRCVSRCLFTRLPASPRQTAALRGQEPGGRRQDGALARHRHGEPRSAARSAGVHLQERAGPSIAGPTARLQDAPRGTPNLQVGDRRRPGAPAQRGSGGGEGGRRRAQRAGLRTPPLPRASPFGPPPLVPPVPGSPPSDSRGAAGGGGGGSRRPPLHVRAPNRSPEASGDRSPGFPPLPPSPVPPYLAGFVELLLQPRHRHRDCARPGPGPGVGAVSGLVRSARPRRAEGAGAGAGPRAAGLRRARLPRPGPRPPPLSHSHTRAHADGNTAFQSPCAAHWPSRGGMQMRPPGPPTPHCCVETRGPSHREAGPGAGGLGVRSSRVRGGQAHAGPLAGWRLYRGHGCGERVHLSALLGLGAKPAFARGQHRLPQAQFG